jgi:hypothetical protein
LGIGIPRLFFGAGGVQAHFRTRNDFVTRCYGKVDMDCQATGGHETAQGSPAQLRAFI